MKEYVSRTVSKMKTLFKKYSVYIISIGISLAISILSALITMGKMSIMETLVKPPLSPPPAAFPIVWTILYILMGISAAIVYKARSTDKKAARSGLIVYAISLAANFLWSVIFFNLEKYLFAFIWLLFLLSLIILTIVEYKKASWRAAFLQIPYTIWVIFAGYLTFGIWLLNK